MRARNIKAEFFINEELAELSYECRLLYIGLWCYADREGRFEWRPKRIKAEIFPYDNKVVIEALLLALTDHGLVITYHDDGKTYAYIPTFKKHQRPHPHEGVSKCPAPSQENQCHDMVDQCNDKVMQCQSDIIINDTIINDIRSNTSLVKFEANSTELILTTLLFDLICERRPQFKKPDLQKAAIEIDRMFRIDKRDPSEAEKIIRWAQKDTFWQNNILSTAKLRKQYDALALKMHSEKVRPKTAREQAKEKSDEITRKFLAGEDRYGIGCIKNENQK
jgi:hypothetical protein